MLKLRAGATTVPFFGSSWGTAWAAIRVRPILSASAPASSGAAICLDDISLSLPDRGGKGCLLVSQIIFDCYQAKDIQTVDCLSTKPGRLFRSRCRFLRPTGEQSGSLPVTLKEAAAQPG